MRDVLIDRSLSSVSRAANTWVRSLYLRWWVAAAAATGVLIGLLSARDLGIAFFLAAAIAMGALMGAQVRTLVLPLVVLYGIVPTGPTLVQVGAAQDQASRRDPPTAAGLCAAARGDGERLAVPR